MNNDTLGKKIVKLYDETTGQSANPADIFGKLRFNYKMYGYYNQ